MCKNLEITDDAGVFCQGCKYYKIGGVKGSDTFDFKR